MSEAATLNWVRAEAVELCRLVEAICPQFGCHVALTGGCLYKSAARKDCDLLFYRIRQCEKIDLKGMWEAFEMAGITFKSGFGWCYKADYKGKPIDMFFPEEDRVIEGPKTITRAKGCSGEL